MRKVALTLVLLFSIIFTGNVWAQEVELPAPGSTPDSPFYFFEKIFEGVGTFFTFGDLNKAARYAVLASERISEAKAMADKANPEAVQNALTRYETQLNQALAKAESAKSKGEATEDVIAKVAEDTIEHLSVLDETLEKAPEEVKEDVLNTKQVSMEGHKKALKKLAEENPEKAIKISLRGAEDRLNRAKTKVDNGEIEEAKKAVNDFTELRKVGGEISEIARGFGKDTTAVEQLVSRSTSNHLKVLGEVYEKVPEEAKESVEKAMEVSVKNQARAMKVLREKGDANEMPEEISLPSQVPAEVQERIKERARQEIEQEKTEEIKEAEGSETSEVEAPEVPEEVSSPSQVPTETKERIPGRDRQEIEQEKTKGTNKTEDSEISEAEAPEIETPKVETSESRGSRK